MADVKFEVEIEADNSADKFTERIVNNLKRDLKVLDLSNQLKISPSEIKMNLAAQGLNAVKTLGLDKKQNQQDEGGGFDSFGMLKLLGIAGLIFAAVKDFPVIVAIAKLLKLVLTLLLLPIIPFLKPVLTILAWAIPQLADSMIAVMDLFDDLLMLNDAAQNIVKFLDTIENGIDNIFIGLVTFLQNIWNAIINFDFSKLISGFGDILQSLFGGILSGLTSALNGILGFLGIAATTNTSGGSISGRELQGSGAGGIGGGGGGGRGSEVTYALSKLAQDLAKSGIPIYKNPFGFQTGTRYISEDRMAMLHKGERVVSATESSGSHSGNTVISVNIDSPSFRSDNDITQLVREIEKRLGKDLRRRVSYTNG